MEMFWSNLANFSGFPAEIFILTLVLILADRKNWRRIAIILSAFILFRLAGEIIKEAVAAPRVCWPAFVPTLIPCPDSFGFPSGHAFGTAMAATIISFIYRRKSVLILVWVVALLIAVARVIVGVHSPIDVIGGMIMGMVSGWIIWKFYWA